MRSGLQIICGVILSVTFAFGESADPAKIVFLHGGKSHSSGVHEFRAGSLLLAEHLNRQDLVPVEAVVHPGWPGDEGVLDHAAAIVIYADATEVIDEAWEQMEARMAQGVGCLMMHYAVHPEVSRGEASFIPWIGGYFKDGKSVNPLWIAEIEPNGDHETSRGINQIRVLDELYFNLEYSQRMIPLGVATPGPENLVRINNLWTESGYAQKGRRQVLLWGIERPEGGRGAGFSGGNFHKNWALDDYRRLLLNTIVWVAGLEVPEGGVPTAPVSEEELNKNLDDYGESTQRIRLPDLLPTVENPWPWVAPGGMLEYKRKLRAKLRQERMRAQSQGN